MKSMIFFVVSIIFSMTLSEARDNVNQMEMKLDMRVLTAKAQFFCRVQNKTERDIRIVESFFWSQFNEFSVVSLNDPKRIPIGLSLDLRINRETLAKLMIVQSGQMHQFRVASGDILRRRNMYAGSYACWQWSFTPWPPEMKTGYYNSSPVCLAFPDPDGNIAPAVVDPRDTSAKPILAFIYHEKKPYELGFLFLNGTDADIVIEKPLTQASRIVASVPAIKYTRELVLPDAKIEKIAVEAGKVGEWRIPWQTLFELIPEEDVEKIKAAGGDLDLVWKVGEYESAPLPLSLSEPENNDEGDEDDDDDAPDGE